MPERGAECGALGALAAQLDPELRRIIDAWDSLPAAVKAGVVALVKTAAK